MLGKGTHCKVATGEETWPDLSFGKMFPGAEGTVGWARGVRNANLVLGSQALSLSGGGGVPPEAPLLWTHWRLAREGQRGSQDTSNLQLVLHKSLQFLSLTSSVPWEAALCRPLPRPCPWASSREGTSRRLGGGRRARDGVFPPLHTPSNSFCL